MSNGDMAGVGKRVEGAAKRAVKSKATGGKKGTAKKSPGKGKGGGVEKAIKKAL